MKEFLLGLAAGALGAYVAIKMSDDATREELKNKIGDLSEKARSEFDHGLIMGRGKALRAGVIARKEVRKGKQKLNQVTGDVAGKLSEEFADIEAKAKANS